MNDIVVRANATVQAMKLMIDALEDLVHHLAADPKLYALLAESPLEDLRRMRDELDQLLEPLKRTSPSSGTSLPTDAITTPIAPGPIESTS
jgi:hypothetical protein